MTNEQLKEFFGRLYEAHKEKGCGGEGMPLANEILDSMGIEEKERNKFLARCRELGCECDCEIGFNIGSDWRPVMEGA